LSGEFFSRGRPRVTLGRVAHYLKPDALLVGLAILAMILATAGELAVPVVLQRTIDEHVVATYRRVVATEGLPGEIGRGSTAVEIADSTFVPTRDFRLFRNEVTESLISRGLVDTEAWHVFVTGREEIRYVTQLKRGLFLLDGASGAIRVLDLERLSRSERRSLRSADISGVGSASLLVAALLVSNLLFSFLHVYLVTYAGQAAMKRIRIELFGRTLRLRLPFHQKHPIGALVTRVSDDVESVNELFANVATSLLKNLFVIAGVVATMFLLDTRLALIAIATTPPIAVATLLLAARARRLFRRARTEISRVSAFLAERISGVSLIQIFAAETRSMLEFEKRSRSLLAAHLAEVRMFALFRPMVDLFTSISIAALLYFGAGLEASETSLGVLVAFVYLVGKFYRPIQEISENFTRIQSAIAGAERVFDLLDTEEQNEGVSPREIQAATPSPPSTREKAAPARKEIGRTISFSHVTFGYDRDEPILHDLSFEIEAGERVALVGFSGAGKSTMLNLLCRFWDPQSGMICIDGSDLFEYRLEHLRTLMQIVEQDVFLFSGSVGENISLGRDITDDEVRSAAVAVGAVDFIERLPRGFETGLKESGVNLSSGQRQLISFARVVAGRPQIVLLDEATSSIDSESELIVEAGIEALFNGRTSITIAHRLSTIQRADRILVVSHGRIVESGSHEELITRDAVYAGLYRLQYAKGDEDRMEAL